jgi:DNA-binding PadR family transcriptional regulator
VISYFAADLKFAPCLEGKSKAMAKNRSSLDVFKGQERRLNLAIFLVLSLSGPLPALKIYKQIIAQKKLSGTHQGSLYKRLDDLAEEGYLRILPPQPGSKAKIYELTNKAFLAVVLDDVSKQELVDKANELDSAILVFEVLKIIQNNPSANSQKKSPREQ